MFLLRETPVVGGAAATPAPPAQRRAPTPDAARCLLRGARHALATTSAEAVAAAAWRCWRATAPLLWPGA